VIFVVFDYLYISLSVCRLNVGLIFWCCEKCLFYLFLFLLNFVLFILLVFMCRFSVIV
jgi:hypothetical protein